MSCQNYLFASLNTKNCLKLSLFKCSNAYSYQLISSHYPILDLNLDSISITLTLRLTFLYSKIFLSEHKRGQDYPSLITLSV